MLERLRHRGPDGVTILANGAAAIGHCLLKVARNGLARRNDLVLALDGRIDNRGELIADLALDPSVGDDMLCLEAYRRWGSSCPQRLLGDFAFVLWDAAANKLVCVRDQVGVRPFYYYDGSEAFLYASEPGAIIAAMPRLAEVVDDVYVADYVAGYPPPPDAFIHPGIRRLPPGCVCLVSTQGCTVEKYFSFKLGEPTSRSDAMQEFARLFEAAIACRLESPRPVASLLSGGLDSSSIVSVAAPLVEKESGEKLTTLSMIFPDTPQEDERPYIDEVISMSGANPVFTESGDVQPFAKFERLLNQQASPFIGPNLAMSGRLHHVARKLGFGVLLDGHGGDEVIAHGTEWLNDLAYRGRLARLWREVRDMGRVSNMPAARIFLALIWSKGPHRPLRRAAGQIVQRLRRRRQPAPGRLRYINSDLATRTRIAQRRTAPPVDRSVFGKEERAAHHQNITSDFQSYALELLDRASAEAGIELRFPLLDRRLIEFCLSLPSSEKLRHGYTRSVLRRALASQLPDKILKRPTKLDFTTHIVRGMVERDSSVIDKVLADESGDLTNYVNLDVVRRAWGNVRAAPIGSSNGYDVQAVWRAVALGLWLKQRKSPGLEELD